MVCDRTAGQCRPLGNWAPGDAAEASLPGPPTTTVLSTRKPHTDSTRSPRPAQCRDTPEVPGAQHQRAAQAVLWFTRPAVLLVTRK